MATPRNRLYRGMKFQSADDCPPLSPGARQLLIESLRESLRDVVKVVPDGQPATCMRHSDSLYVAPGVNLRELKREPSGERGRS